MPLHHPALRAVLAVLLPAFAATMLSPYTAWADMAVSTEINGLNTTVTSTAATSTNLGLLQSKVDELNAQIGSDQTSLNRMSRNSSNYTVMQSKIAQLNATVDAMQKIISRLQDGYSITGYTTSTDASDQVTTVTSTFTKAGTGTDTGTSTVTMTAMIPAVADPRDDLNSDESDYDNSSSSGSGGFDGSDMLTQMLQQVAMQQIMGGGGNPLTGLTGMVGGGMGGGNPLSAIQPALNNIVSSNLAPAVPNPAAAAKVQCAADTATTGAGNGVAVYDIAAGKVYMPDGTVLDAHSGMGNMMDNPDYVNQPNSGPTPPNVYNLSMRESPYYGVEALRLTPTDPGSMYGRSGILAHTKLVRGANNGSHGCVAFADYAKFLAAFKSGQVKQLVVVPRKNGVKSVCRPPAYDKPHGGTAPISI